MFLRELLTEDRVKDLDKVLKPYLKNNHTSRDWAAIIILTSRPTLFQLKDLFKQYSSALKDLSSDEIYKIIDHYIDTYSQARSAITKGNFKASNFPYKERVLNLLFQSPFPTVNTLRKEHQLNKENNLSDPLELRDTASRRGSLRKTKPQITPTPIDAEPSTPADAEPSTPTDAEPSTPTDAEPSTPTDAEPSTPSTDQPTDTKPSVDRPRGRYGIPDAEPGTEEALLVELYKHTTEVDNWSAMSYYTSDIAVMQIASLIIAASPQAGLAMMQQMERYYYQDLGRNYGKKKITYPGILKILKKYRNIEKTNPALKAWEDLPSEVKNSAWQKYKMHVRYGLELTDTGANPRFRTLGTDSAPDPDDLPKLPRPGTPRDKAYTSLDNQMKKYDKEYIDDTEEILGKRYRSYGTKVTPEQITKFFANVSTVTVDYDVFDWNLRLLVKNNFVDPINTLDDPILQIGIMGDPRTIESTIKASKDLKIKYGKERKVIARWPGMGIWGAAYGGPNRTDTILAGEDQLMAYHPARAVRTDAHELRHRAFNIISLIPVLREKLPADLRPGGKWWGSYGDGKYIDFSKVDIASGAWAEHALLYAVDYAEGTIPERRMGFFDNKIFNTKDYPVSYWKKLYYDTSRVVGEFLKEIGADKNFKKPKPLNYYNRPPLPGDDIEISNSMAPYVKTNPGWTEMYRHIILNKDIQTLADIETALKGDMFMGGYLEGQVLGLSEKIKFDRLVEEAKQALFNGHFARAHKFVFPNVIKKCKDLMANWMKEKNRSKEPVYMANNINYLESAYKILGKMKDIEMLMPAYFARKVKAGEIEPATNAELRRILPYSIADYRDHKAQIELGAIPLPGVEPKGQDPISSRSTDRDFLLPDPEVVNGLTIPNYVYGSKAGDSSLVQYSATVKVIAYLLGYITDIDRQIPWPANYDMDATIQYYNAGGEKRKYTRMPNVPYPITGQIANQLKAAYEAAQNGTEPTYTGPDIKIPTSEEPPLSPTPEPTQEPDVEPTDEPDYDDESDIPADEPDDIPYDADELQPIPYYVGSGVTIDDPTILTFNTTSLFLSRLSSGVVSAAYESYSEEIQWPGNHDLDKAINFYNYWISKNPEDYRSRDLPKRINDTLRRELRQKYAKLKRQGELT